MTLREYLSKRQRISDFLYLSIEGGDLERTSQSSIGWAIGFAASLSLTARAPQDWAPGRPLHSLGGHPPAPQFEQMRIGQLAQLSEEFGQVPAGGVIESANTTVWHVEGGDVYDDGDDDGDDDDDDDDGDDDDDDDEDVDEESRVGCPGMPSLATAASPTSVHPRDKVSRQVNINFLDNDDSGEEG